MISNMQAGREQLGKKQVQISSGKKYATRSQAPVDSAQIAALHERQQLIDQWKKNGDIASTWTKISEARISSVVDVTQRARELIVQAGDLVNNPQDKKNIANEINSLLESTLMTANSKFGEYYLFGGTNSGQIPFTATRDGNGQITAVTTAVGTFNKRSIQVDEVSTMQYGSTAAGTDGIFRNTTEGTDLFQTLIDVRDDLMAGNTLTQMGDIEQNMQVAVNHLVDNGVSQNRFQELSTYYDKLNLSEQTHLSKLEDTDLALAISEMSLLETALQATLQISARMDNINIMNFI